MRQLTAIIVAVAIVAAVGCGGDEGVEGGDYTVGTVGPGGEYTTMSHDDALEYIFDHEEFPAQLTAQICRVIDNRGEEEARRLFVSTWSSDSFEFSGGELFDEAAGRC